MRRSRYAPRLHERDELHSPVVRYLHNGNARPSRAQLESSIAQLRRSEKPTTALVMADMCLDLAMVDRDNAAKHVGTAGEILADTVEHVAFLGSAGYAEALKLRPVSIQAQFRIQELPNWQRASAGEPTETDYDALLGAHVAVDPDTAYGIARSKMVEAMPLLLGARALAQGKGSGWVGRLGLAREERKGIIPIASNPNWDTGITFDDDNEAFVAPPVRLQIKSTPAQSQRYQNAGVTPLSSRRFGFNNPAQIVASCLMEQGEKPLVENMPFDILVPDQLDAITDRIARHIS